MSQWGTQRWAANHGRDWLWITNQAILLGAEMDAELERGRAIAAGHDPEDEPFLQLRDDRKLKKGSEKGLST